MYLRFKKLKDLFSNQTCDDQKRQIIDKISFVEKLGFCDFKMLKSAYDAAWRGNQIMEHCSKMVFVCVLAIWRTSQRKLRFQWKYLQFRSHAKALPRFKIFKYFFCKIRTLPVKSKIQENWTCTVRAIILKSSQKVLMKIFIVEYRFLNFYNQLWTGSIWKIQWTGRLHFEIPENRNII